MGEEKKTSENEKENLTYKIGFIPAALDLSPGSNDIVGLEKDLQAARTVLNLTELTLTPAPVGVAFITCDASVTQFRKTVVPLLEKYRSFPCPPSPKHKI